MRINTRKHLPRRTFLQGVGVAVGLPLLDSMVPANTLWADTAAKPQLRYGFMYMPHGAVMSNWTPVADGADYTLSRTLEPLKNVKDSVLVLTGLAHRNAGSLGPGDSGGDHGRGPSVFLNASHPKRTEGEDVRAGTTIDQIAAERIGQDSPLPSLELATEDMTGLIGACDVGFSCTYTNTISWKTPTTPLPMEINPRNVFDRLFGDGSTTTERMKRLQRERSILDSVTAEVNHLQGKLGAGDRNKVSEYLDNVREIERRIQLAEKKQSSNDSGVFPAQPVGIPDNHEEHSKLMFDLMALSYQADVTRIVSFMMAREVSYRTFPMIGVNDPFHATSHHQNDPDKLEKLTKINTYHVGLMAYFLEKLRSIPDGDGNLLDHSLLLYGSCMSNSNLHNHGPLPIFVAGGANGQLKGGKHVKYPNDTPAANLLLSILDKADINLDSIGDSDGRLSGV
ncbi:MAG TPA: DUF1552 domain-containing protein [Bryobacteraceae bacterium]|nr:DUF1552 domain-containing protein [Bryobacteraceae bacterium]